MYSRSTNEGGSLNTRCLYCFRTIASDVETIGELERIEARHICPEMALAQFTERQMCSGPLRFEPKRS